MQLPTLEATAGSEPAKTLQFRGFVWLLYYDTILYVANPRLLLVSIVRP
jgi:hypothetical protein